MLISGSWDGSVRLWDLRARDKCTANLRQPERVYTMDIVHNKLVVGTAGRHIWIWDLRRMKEPEQRRESSLKYQTRCLRAYPDGAGFAVSSIEGRVAMEYFDPSPEAQSQKYALIFLRKIACPTNHGSHVARCISQIRLQMSSYKDSGRHRSSLSSE